MVSKLFFIFILAFVSRLNGVTAVLPGSAVHNAATGLILAADSPAAANVNPALISGGLEIGTARLFNMFELPVYSVHYGYRRKAAGFYVGAVHLNHNLYRQSMINMSAAYLASGFSVGGSLRTMTSKAVGYRRDTSLLADFGFAWQREMFKGGFSVKNISNTKVKGQTLPVLFQAETSCQITGDGIISLGIEKEKGYDFALRTASSFRLHENLMIIAGYQHRPARIGTGFVFFVDTFSISYGMLSHEVLAATHFFSIGYRYQGDYIAGF